MCVCVRARAVCVCVCVCVCARECVCVWVYPLRADEQLMNDVSSRSSSGSSHRNLGLLQQTADKPDRRRTVAVLKHETEHHRKRKSVQQSLDEEIGLFIMFIFVRKCCNRQKNYCVCVNSACSTQSHTHTLTHSLTHTHTH